MFRSLCTLIARQPLGHWCRVAALAACLGISGCTTLNLRGDGFADNELSNWAGQMRGVDRLGPSHAFSNKARQIDRNLGGPRDTAPIESW